MLFNSVYLEKNFITLFIIIVLLQLANTEFFTAIADVEKLLHTEEEIVKSLEKYLQLEEIRITQLKRLKKMYTDLHKLANQDPEAFLSNPVNAFLLVKRLTTDWDTANFLIKNADSQSDLYNAINQPGIIFPEYEDLNGAAVALMRLQSIYQLDTSSIAKGLLKDAMVSSPLNAADCFELGKQAYNVGYLKYTLMWMQESLNRLENEEIPTVPKIDVLEYMAYSAYDGISNLPEFRKKLTAMYYHVYFLYLRVDPLGSYTRIKSPFLRLVTALEVFNRYNLQHVHDTLLGVL